MTLLVSKVKRVLTERRRIFDEFHFLLFPFFPVFIFTANAGTNNRPNANPPKRGHRVSNVPKRRKRHVLNAREISAVALLLKIFQGQSSAFCPNHRWHLRKIVVFWCRAVIIIIIIIIIERSPLRCAGNVNDPVVPRTYNIIHMYTHVALDLVELVILVNDSCRGLLVSS